MKLDTALAFITIAVGAVSAGTTKEEEIAIVQGDALKCAVENGLLFMKCLASNKSTEENQEAVAEVPKVARCALISLAKFILCFLDVKASTTNVNLAGQVLGKEHFSYLKKFSENLNV